MDRNTVGHLVKKYKKRHKTLSKRNENTQFRCVFVARKNLSLDVNIGVECPARPDGEQDTENHVLPAIDPSTFISEGGKKQG